ncbi:MAG TPA: methyltransferase domain-containing protein [Thermoanaerobaculia bacterium]|nr:methyltransferase domain-containing protein [Thermoanaerobaculia bacterium]
MVTPVLEREELRAGYARTVCAVTGIATPAVLHAFATVPRERYLPRGPWPVLRKDGVYETTPDADPVHLYRDVTVGLDPERRLNNGQPSILAHLIDRLGAREGDRLVHVGCGTGYYTAIFAELVGPSGRVEALEVEPELAAQARENLGHLPQVRVLEADGTTWDPGPVERIFVNAGVTHPLPLWLDRLADGGTLVAPLTNGDWLGGFLRVERRRGRYAARFVLGGAAYPCVGGRDAGIEAALAAWFPALDQGTVQSLRRDVHEVDETCWLHAAGFCLSTAPAEVTR